jgi:hypothetical protein
MFFDVLGNPVFSRGLLIILTCQSKTNKNSKTSIIKLEVGLVGVTFDTSSLKLG